MKKLFIFWIIGYLFIGILPKAFAQTPAGLDITVSPSLIDVSANPGDIIKQKFRVRNNMNAPITLSLSLDKLAPSSTGEIKPVKAQANDPSLSWVVFEKNTVDAQSREWTDIAFTITVPKEAAFGYYYAIHLGQANKKDTITKNGANIVGEVIIPLLLNVKSPHAKAEIHLLNFTTQPINEYLPITFSLELQNTGNIHLRPKGSIFIRTGFSDKDTAILDINQNNGTILPGSKRTFTSTWTDGFVVQEQIIEDGTPKFDTNGKPLTHLVFNWNRLTHFRIGKYTVTALVVYDNGTRDIPLQATTTFWVIPWKFMIVTLTACLVLVIFIRALLKWYIAKEVKKYRNQ